MQFAPPQFLQAEFLPVWDLWIARIPSIQDTAAAVPFQSPFPKHSAFFSKHSAVQFRPSAFLVPAISRGRTEGRQRSFALPLQLRRTAGAGTRQDRLRAYIPSLLRYFKKRGDIQLLLLNASPSFQQPPGRQTQARRHPKEKPPVPGPALGAAPPAPCRP